MDFDSKRFEWAARKDRGREKVEQSKVKPMMLI
jgi:hypothetical protein